MKPAVCILGAVRQEIAGIKRRMKIDEQVRLGRADAWAGTWENTAIVLVRTGIGQARARDALERVLEKYSVSTVISIGYAGGLDPKLKVGDLVVANRILGLCPEKEQGDEEFFADPALVERALLLPVAAGATAVGGELLTVDRVVCDPESKRALLKRYLALAGDMETAALAKLAAEKPLPFLSVRAISDTAEQKLLDVTSFVEADGEVSKLKAGWYVLTHPGSLKFLNDIRQHAGRATNVMTDFLAGFLKAAP